MLHGGDCTYAMVCCVHQGSLAFTFLIDDITISNNHTMCLSNVIKSFGYYTSADHLSFFFDEVLVPSDEEKQFIFMTNVACKWMTIMHYIYTLLINTVIKFHKMFIACFILPQTFVEHNMKYFSYSIILAENSFRLIG